MPKSSDQPDDLGTPVPSSLRPINRSVHDYWQRVRRNDPLPPTSALDPLKIPKAALPYFTVVEVIEPGPRFLVRLTGTRVRDITGQDYTGRMVDEMPGAEDVVRRFTWCVENRRPYSARSKLHWATNAFREYEALVVPFGAPDGRIEKLASVIVFL